MNNGGEMQLFDVIRISIRMLRTNFLRSLLTISGIGVAITFIVLLIGFGYGIQTLTIGSIIQSKTLLTLTVQADIKQNAPLLEANIAPMEKLPGITAATPVIISGGQSKIAGQLAALTIEAGNESYLKMQGIEVRNGRAYKDGSREAVVAPQTLDLLGLKPTDVLGQTITIQYTDPNNANQSKDLADVIVVGVSGTADAPTLYLPISLLNPDGQSHLTSIQLTAKDRSTVITDRNTLANQGYNVESLLQTLDQAQRVFYWATVTLSALGAIALIVASIGMFNTLTIALIERTREIGIMKAIGVTDQAIRRLFLAEAAIIGLCGGVMGISVGVGVGALFGFVVNTYAKSYQAAPVNLFQYPPGFLIGILIFPILLSMLTGLYPAIRASRLNPLRALRYE